MGPVQQRFTVDVDAPPERVFPLVADLERYEHLLDIVHLVKPERGPESGEDQSAWSVTLRAKIGPFARSKRLRMERTAHDPLTMARFERVEHDGRDHSPWILEATVAPDGAVGSRVEMMLDYRGRLWSGVLDGVLRAQVARAGARLEELATAPPASDVS